MKTIVFTDLDGTLLHADTYFFEEALPALDLLKKMKIPLVLCSSKTRSELELYRKRLENTHPFISENGGGVFVPPAYFDRKIVGEVRDDLVMVALGRNYNSVRREFVELRERLGARVAGFGDMTTGQVSVLTGLPYREAGLAKERDFSEPFIFEQNEDAEFLAGIVRRGLHWTRGRLYCAMGDHDKGKAVRMLKKWYASSHDKLITIGLGDASNDEPLLREVDVPILVRKTDGTYDKSVRVPGLILSRGIGPLGWNSSILSWFERHNG